MSWFKKVFSSFICEIPKKDKKANEDPQISGLKIEQEEEVKKTLRKATKKVGLVHEVD